MDRDAIEALYRRYGVVVHRRLRRALGSDDAALDATQEVFARALAHGGGFRGEAEGGTWLFRITTNLAIDLLRARARRDDRTDGLDAPPEAPAPGRPEDRVLAQRLLGHVPERTARIALLYHVEEMTGDEVANELGISRRAVTKHLSRFAEQARALTASRPTAAPGRLA